MDISEGGNSQLVTLIGEVFSVPPDRIQHLMIIVTYDTGVAMAHDACCNEHAREFLANLAATPPDLTGIERFTGSN